ncbi:penicillin-binding protein [Clostridium sp. MSJ-4]|uniref:Penicillin-binding protein n=1 Tax=Clostridium simiarum TaxID=2841506 RepID=A0ABS6F2J5_9CLOT|nr:penicillin-binding transpeptidase domain-containing protein [Clostridium simiarum]MBU5592739.1 penicillin-binding protein [Clostridium simiarum]
MKDRKQTNRYTALVLVMMIIFTAILSRLAYLQIIKYDDNKEQANNKSVRYLSESAPRGNILAKDGSLLATSVQSYVLTFMETEESKKYFFKTMDMVFKMLDEQDEVLQDTFPLKVDPFRFEFNTSDADTLRALELRFKKDRGFDFKVQQKLYPKQKSDLTTEQKRAIDEELLKITPEETFYGLVKDKTDYQIYKLLGYSKEDEKTLLEEKSGKEITEMLKGIYSLETLRKYILVKDAINMQKFSGFKPITLSSNIKRDSSFVFLQKLNDLPGVDVVVQPIREYPYKSLASAVIGYIGTIDGGQKDKYEERGYDVSTDLIGKSGIESAFEDRLKGSKGGNTVKVNKYGRKTEELFRLDPYPGQNIQLSIDKKLQYVAERALEDKMKYLQSNGHRESIDTRNANRGAVIVQDVNTGKILSMVSAPSFDPNLMAVPGRMSNDLVKQYFAPDLKEFGENYIKSRGLKVSVDDIFPLVDKNNPKNTARDDRFDIYPKATYNYATMGAVPPGSTYKPITAAAGLEAGVIDPSTRILDQGVFNKHEEFKNYTGACEIWTKSGGSHGNIDVKQALEVSCNYYFYEVGYRLYKEFGLDGLAQYSWKFGLGKDPKSKTKSTTGIEIAEDTRGQVYNYESFKNLVASMSAHPLVDILESGRSSRGHVFKPLPITKNEEDTKDLAEAKEVVKELVKEEILKDYTSAEVSGLITNFKPKIKDAIKNFISKLPEDKRDQYKESDIDSMIAAITAFIYYDKRGEVTTGAEVFNASIGQGMNSFTPLQLNNAIATLVNGGTRYRTTLIDRITDSNGEVVEETKPEVLENLNLKQTTVDTIKEGMRKVDETGTANSVFQNFPISTGGKTGTATYKENGEQEKVGRAAYGVYVGFAPFDKPEIAVTIIIYDGGHGFFGADVVKAVYEEYFRDEILEKNPNYKFTYNYTLEEPTSTPKETPAE